MNEKQLYRVIGLIDDDLILGAETAEPSLIRKRALVRWMAAAACLALFALFGTVFAVNSEFREAVISFFKSEQIEKPIVPPTSSPHASPAIGASEPIISTPPPLPFFIGEQSIDGIARVSYFQFDGYVSFGSDIVTVSADDGFHIYKRDNQELTEVIPQRYTGSISVNGWELPLSFLYIEDEWGIRTFDNVYDSDNGGEAAAMWSRAGDFLWVSFLIRRELHTWVCYNMETGEVRDIIGEAGITCNGDTEISMSPDGSTLLVRDRHSAYLVDIATATSQEIIAFRGSRDMSVSYIDDETLSFSLLNPDISDTIRFSSYTYDIGSGETTLVFEDAAYYSQYEPEGIRGLGNGISILVEDGQCSVVDHKTMTRYLVEGLMPGENVSYLLSPDGRKISVEIRNGEEGNGIVQMGYIDMETQELKMFERKDFPGEYETVTYWVSPNELAVTSVIDGRSLYIYRFE